MNIVKVSRRDFVKLTSAASAGLDAFTQANTRSNTASTSDNDIFGTFTILG